MGKLSTDIDELLEETEHIDGEDAYLMLNQIEIDVLLENTRDW
ncbi:hypothetical protein AB1K84_04920 [Mesobacillus foraminis]|uniref:Uncharacterized protein n=1 Tax=Mesobacillus foraminis TaxID=279826 RepID=A0A4R2BK78_9BACI|nr:hypothetical protein [Mesobacillus foraminis]TCN27386.1 hypothetical protein EV146_102336 [Mesobacillus foraminis]